MLSLEEMACAEQALVYVAQGGGEEGYPKKLEGLKNEYLVGKRSKLYRILPFLNEHGIIRLKKIFNNAVFALPYETFNNPG